MKKWTGDLYDDNVGHQTLSCHIYINVCFTSFIRGSLFSRIYKVLKYAHGTDMVYSM